MCPRLTVCLVETIEDVERGCNSKERNSPKGTPHFYARICVYVVDKEQPARRYRIPTTPS